MVLLPAFCYEYFCFPPSARKVLETSRVLFRAVGNSSRDLADLRSFLNYTYIYVNVDSHSSVLLWWRFSGELFCIFYSKFIHNSNSIINILLKCWKECKAKIMSGASLFGCRIEWTLAFAKCRFALHARVFFLSSCPSVSSSLSIDIP